VIPARRVFLRLASAGPAAAALAALHDRDGRAAPGVIGRPPLPQRARRVIWLSMAGGPSQFESFDPKPTLAALHGQPMPTSFTAGQQLAQLQGQRLVCHAPQFRFRRHGRCGTEISELFPHIGGIADRICLVRSLATDAINHDPAHMLMNTGAQIAGRPSMGAWVTYGLGSDADDLPGFVVMVSTGPGRSPQPIAARQWGSGFLPGRTQGVPLSGTSRPIHYLDPPAGVARDRQAADVAAITALDRQHDRLVHDPEIATRVAQYEMAFRLQTSVPALV